MSTKEDSYLVAQVTRARCILLSPFYTDSQMKALANKEIVALDQDQTNDVAGSIQLEINEKHRLFSSHDPRQNRRNGCPFSMAFRQRCSTMEELPPGVVSLTRQHALSCSGAEQFFLQRIPELTHHDALPPINIPSRILNRYRLEKPSATFFFDVEHASNMVYRLSSARQRVLH